MSKNPSDRNRVPGDTYETERDSSQDASQRKESMASKQEGRKFVSDDDIVGRQDYRRVQTFKRQGKEPKFVSDDDIIQRRAG